MPNNALLELAEVHFAYAAGVTVLAGACLSLEAGECVALLGASGTGKSTVLALAGLLTRPQRGAVVWHGEDTAAWNETARAHWRRQHLGFVFQQHHLLDDFTLAENVGLPLRWQQKKLTPVAGLLETMQLSSRGHAYPPQLSGGEQQRAAIARALVHQPQLVLADEPTGNLDPANAQTVLALLMQAARAQGAAVLLVTHDPAVAAAADRRITLHERLIG